MPLRTDIDDEQTVRFARDVIRNLFVQPVRWTVYVAAPARALDTHTCNRPFDDDVASAGDAATTTADVVTKAAAAANVVTRSRLALC